MFGAPTYQAVFVLVLILALIFLYLLGYTFWTRAKKKYWARYGKKFRAIFVPLIFEFVESAEKHTDADEVIKKVTRRHEDIELFISIVDEMFELLQGKDRQKLIWLIEHPLFNRYYFKKLNSLLRSDQLRGCVYYGKSGNIKQKVVHRLIKLSNSKDIRIAFGATKALQNSQSRKVRIISLMNFFKRTDTTILMVGELLHLFHLNSERMYIITGHSLKKVLLEKDISKDKKGIVIQYIAHHNLYEYSTFLHHYLQKLLYRTENKSLIKILIRTLGILRVEEASHLIRNYSIYPDPSLRLCCVEALTELGGEENFAFVTDMLLDMEFDVRKLIITSLAQNPDSGHLLLDNFMQTYGHYLSKVWASGTPPRDFPIFVDKLESVLNGIRITVGARNNGQKSLSL